VNILVNVSECVSVCVRVSVCSVSVCAIKEHVTTFSGWHHLRMTGFKFKFVLCTWHCVHASICACMSCVSLCVCAHKLFAVHLNMSLNVTTIKGNVIPCISP